MWFLADGGEPAVDGWFHHSAGWGWLVMVGLSLLIVIALVLTVRGAAGDRREVRRGRPDARLTLDERFARGEIDEAEYRSRLSALRS